MSHEDCCLVSTYVQLFFHPRDCSPPGSSIHGISQARMLEWDAISFSIFLTPGWNPSLLPWQADSLQLSHPEAPHEDRTQLIQQKERIKILVLGWLLGLRQ